MPQIQILPSVPTFGSRLAQALGQAGSDVAEGFASKRRTNNIQNLTSELADPNKSDIQKVGIITKLSQALGPEHTKNLLPFLSDLYSGSSQGQPPGTATQPGVPQGQSEAPTAATQPQGVQNAPAPTGQTEEERAARRQQLVRRTGLPGGEKAKQALKLDIEEEKIGLKKSAAEERRIDKSYEAQKDFIDKTSSQNQSWETEFKPRLLQLQNLNNEELIGPTAAKILDSLGYPLGALENPSNELYSKLSQDLLKGLPETYGNRILKVEVDNFLKTIPTLLNSPDGRRLIASNMLKLGEMKEVFYNEMRRQQKDLLSEDKKFPRDFEQQVFDNVKPQIDRINSEFQQLGEIKSVPKDTTPYFNPQGDVVFVPNTPEAQKFANENGGKRIW